MTSEGPNELVGTNVPIQHAQRIDALTFPNPPLAGAQSLPTTIENVAHLLASYRVTARYNVISKRVMIEVPGFKASPENADNIAFAQISSLAALNGLSLGLIPAYVQVIADRNPYNPVAEWITSRSWDGESRKQLLYDSLVEREGYPKELKKTLVYRWLLSAVAAALKVSGFKARGVLTLQGPQSIGKSSWVAALVPDPVLREQVVKLDQHIDAGNKDTLLTAIGHWIVELGELDSSFRKDIARLKGFLTSDRDKLRRPYAKADSEYPRRTVFTATVNDDSFLVDSSGNTRFWTIPVEAVNFNHGIDMQQLFAELAVDFEAGEQWWLTKEEEVQLEETNQAHRVLSAVHQRVEAILDLSREVRSSDPALSATEVLGRIGILNPSNAQARECGTALRDLIGEPKKYTGIMKWRVPLKDAQTAQIRLPEVSDDDKY